VVLGHFLRHLDRTGQVERVLVGVEELVGGLVAVAAAALLEVDGRRRDGGVVEEWREDLVGHVVKGVELGVDEVLNVGGLFGLVDVA